MKKKIIIVGGDPNSINSEIIFKTWKKLNSATRKKIVIISNYHLLTEQFKKLKYSIDLQKIKDINDNFKNNQLKILNVNLNFKDPFIISENVKSKFVLQSLNLAHKFALKKSVKGIINCPIDKKLLKKSKIGVTEYLASKCNIKDNSEVMLIGNNKLFVAPITTHIDLKDVSKKIKKEDIVKKIITIEKWFKKNLRKKPKIGILGLNPHNAELRKNSEEKKFIIPAIKLIKKYGISLTGPLVSDTLFIDKYKNFDVIVGMYHDQVLTPFKTLFKYKAINITLGLKYCRVSPDHGTAVDIIKKKVADENSLISCVNFVNKYGK